MAYSVEVPVRFGDVDYARIVYYPRLFHLLHVAFEELFAQHVGIPYDRLIVDHNLGFPAVHSEAEFRRPLRYGDTLRVEFRVPRIGNSSVDFDHQVWVDSEPEPRLVMLMTRVAVDMHTLRPVPIPDHIRASLEQLAPAAG